MTELYKIEKDIPVPCSQARGVLNGTIRQMEVGDSLVIPERARNQASVLAARIGIKITSRSVAGSGNVRIWRVE